MSMALILLISVSLAMDCFAVSLAAGTCNKELRLKDSLFIAFMFGLFQSGMAFIGWGAGTGFIRYIEAYDHWIAFIMLLFIGAKMIIESFKHESEKCMDYTSARTVLALAVATSIDALAVGISFSAMKFHIVFPLVMIGAASFIFSAAGVYIGKKTGEILGSKAELIGGIVLIGVGVKVLIG